MKEGIHPEYREVIFKDISTDYAFKTRSTIKTKDTITWEDGNEYPLVKLEISSDSHPFYTGKTKFIDTEGRVERFQNKYSGKYASKKQVKKPKLEKIPKIKKLNTDDPSAKKGGKKADDKKAEGKTDAKAEEKKES